MKYQIADLFCGAGGTSTGAMEAVSAMGRKPLVTAINHWTRAIETHTANHPDARHLCTGLDSVNPRDLYEEGRLDLLWASPECTHHSIARGGRPVSDQSRATAWCVVRWAEALRPPVILVENVPEFQTWGPIGSKGQPLASRKGETFRAWLGALQSLGYKTDHRLLCAADYGDPTTRRRLFVQAVRGRRRIVWPEATHSREGDLLATKRWVAAREIIDWQLQGESIYERKRPLSEKTMARIMAGLTKFGLGPFITAWDNQSAGAGGGLSDIGEPISTVVTKARHGVAQPFLVKLRGTSKTADIDRPAPTITAGGGHLGLVEAGLLPQHSGGALRPVDQPTPTITCAGAVALIEPFLVSYYGNGGPRSVDRPVDTVTTKDRLGLVRPVVEIEGARYQLDIRFRMLQPHELAAAQGFPKGYTFAGTKSDQVKQIGNSVPRRLARALVAAVVGQNPDVTAITDPPQAN